MRVRVAPAERFALAGAAAVLLLQSAGLGPALEYRRAMLAAEPWRLLTGHLVHANWRHAVLNALAWVALARLYAPELSPARQATLLAGSALAISLLLWVAAPDVAWYRGLSGALHGVFAAGACLWLARPAAGTVHEPQLRGASSPARDGSLDTEKREDGERGAEAGFREACFAPPEPARLARRAVERRPAPSCSPSQCKTRVHGLGAALLRSMRAALSGAQRAAQRPRLWPALLLAAVWGKVLAEQTLGPMANENWLGVAVITRSHLFGAAAGTVLGILTAALRADTIRT